jgi:hypothetical protein
MLTFYIINVYYVHIYVRINNMSVYALQYKMQFEKNIKLTQKMYEVDIMITHLPFSLSRFKRHRTLK